MYLNGHSTDVGNEFSLSIMYLEPLKGDLFIVHCICDVTHFSALGGESLKLTNECREISWKEDRLNCLEFTYN